MPSSVPAYEPFANYIGLGNFPAARFRFDFRHQRLGQAYGECLHRSNVLHLWLICKTNAPDDSPNHSKCVMELVPKGGKRERAAVAVGHKRTLRWAV